MSCVPSIINISGLFIHDCPFGLLYCLFNTESFAVDCLINYMYAYYSVITLAVIIGVLGVIIIILIYSKYQNLFNSICS